MVIRFQCGACSQPIETDDDWAAKPVACPYCRKTVTAPAQSTLDDLSGIPAAAPVATSEAFPGAPAPLSLEQGLPPATQRNRLAVVALVLASSLPAFMIAFISLSERHEAELAEVQKGVEQLQGEGVSPIAAQYQAWQEYLAAHGGIPPEWMIVSAMLELAALAAWIATIVCGLIAVRRPRRRPLAVTALVIAGVVPAFFCCGGGGALGLGAWI